MHDEDLEFEEVMVRRLRPDDMDAVVRLDAKVTGRRRERFFESKLAMALAHSGIEVSLAAELDGLFVGFLIAQVYYGEFGQCEPVAVLDTIDVHPDFAGRGVGTAMLRQLRQNLKGLRIGSLRTEVHWDDQRLMSWFHREGFTPAPRVSLDLDIDLA